MIFFFHFEERLRSGFNTQAKFTCTAHGFVTLLSFIALPWCYLLPSFVSSFLSSLCFLQTTPAQSVVQTATCTQPLPNICIATCLHALTVQVLQHKRRFGSTGVYVSTTGLLWHGARESFIVLHALHLHNCIQIPVYVQFQVRLCGCSWDCTRSAVWTWYPPGVARAVTPAHRGQCAPLCSHHLTNLTAWVLQFQLQHKTSVSSFSQTISAKAVAPFVPTLNKTYSTH